MKYLALLALTFTLVACQSTNSNEPGAGDAEAATSSGINGVYAGGSYDPATGLNGSYQSNSASNSDHYSNPDYGKNVVGGPDAQAKDRVIYFSYDSSAIDSRAEAIVQQHAAYLKKHPNTRILLEGHTDSRGSREYNIALGERRAISVLKRFQALGVPVSQIRIISYGEENPAVSGFTEDAYRRNRRAVIQY
ncbi:MAG: peptidoglycan-associated lipoprotein [Gammaproteobacteria bacterium]|nr:MAG: peptidoglycan-associated lipoprotein [Gammaproteobacteria bacterium]